jgi:hypothetical protein
MFQKSNCLRLAANVWPLAAVGISEHFIVNQAQILIEALHLI